MESPENPKRRPSLGMILQIIGLFAAVPLAYWIVAVG